ncbi:MAG: penicillin-binding protein [Gemmatimonadetes bacterium]|nr:penicillin-binding protein [Gemmatimonadota bacterium]
MTRDVETGIGNDELPPPEVIHDAYGGAERGDVRKLRSFRLRSRTTRGGAVVVLAAGVWALSRVFSVSCAGDAPCLTLNELAKGAPLPEAVHVFDRFGAPLADVAGPMRIALQEDDIPPRLAAAFVAVEDRRFWKHDGVDYHGAARALVQDISAGGVVEGASTIPMQLVRTVWADRLGNMDKWRRKIIEVRTAPLLVDRLGRDRVLALYLNSIYLGNGVYGVEAASRYYFGVPADSLDLAQIATLVGMTSSPELYEPRRHPRRSLARRNTVLGVLVSAGVATPEEAARVRARPLATAPQPDLPRGRSHLTAAVMREIRDVAPDLAGQPGLRVFTGIDPRIQEAGEDALTRRLSEVAKQAGHMDDTLNALEGGAVALDPHTGAVRAWVGGRDFGVSEFDHVSQAHRQVGSLVKPFIVATALEDGVGILDLVSTLPDSVESGGVDWAPADHVTTPILPLREALIHSSNRAAVNLGRYLGIDAVRQVGRETGIESDIPTLPSSFIGAFESSLLEMTTAYAVFDNGGVRVTPHLVGRIEGPDGTVLWQRTVDDVPEQALDPVTSYVVLDALRGVVDRGTASPLRAWGYSGPAAGKTGTTNDGRDAWFIGMLPDLVAGVWIGYDRPRTILPGASGGSVAAPAWATWMRRVDAELGAPRGEWLPPDGVERVTYDIGTGEVYRDGCTSLMSRHEEAYVRRGRYDVRSCPGSLGDWLSNLWHTFVPKRLAPIIGAPSIRGGG